MSNNSIRGQETTFRVAVDGELLEGSVFNVNDWTVTERGELKETPFIGEDVDKIDYQHNGWDLSFTVQNQDAVVLEFLTKIVDRELNHQAHPDITITIIYNFRNNAGTRVEVYYNCYLRPTDISAGSRTDYVTSSFEAKAERRRLLSS